MDNVCKNPECGCVFTPKREWQKYCSETCSYRARYIRKAESIKERSRQYYHRTVTEKSRELKRDYHRRYSEKNRLALREVGKVFYRNNKAAAFQRSAERRARKMNASPEWDVEFTKFVTKEAYRLANLRLKATGIQWHLDHQVPLQGDLVCGLHVWNNLALLTARENLMKHNKLLPEFSS